MGDDDESWSGYCPTCHQTDRDAEVRALRSQVAGLEASLLAGRADVERLGTKLDASEMKMLWHKADAKVANEKHTELVRLVREWLSADDAVQGDTRGKGYLHDNWNDAREALRAAYERNQAATPAPGAASSDAAPRSGGTGSEGNDG